MGRRGRTAEVPWRGSVEAMRARIDKAGRLVIPRALRDRIGLAGGGEVELELDGAGVRIEPIPGTGFREEGALLFIPAGGSVLTDASVRKSIEADRDRR